MRNLSLLGLMLAGAAVAGPFRTDADAVFRAARRDHKPVLVDFFGIWCPPCNQLDEVVFESRAFLEKSKAFHLLRIDADSPSSWKIKSKYQVGGYPTIVFADPKGGEVHRLVGFRPTAEFLKAMDLVLAAKGRDLSRSCQSTDVEDLWRCATICSGRDDTACAEKAFSRLQGKLVPGSSRDLEVKTFLAEKAPTEDLRRQGYERLLAEHPKSPRALYWGTLYLEGFEKGSQPEPRVLLLQPVLAAFAEMAKDSAGLADTGLTEGDLFQLRAQILSRLGRAGEAVAAWKQAAEYLESQAKALAGAGLPPRGFSMERVYCLEQAGEVESALKLVDELRARYPDEFTFHFTAASILHRAKRYPQALPIARRAWEVSYGDNRIRVATLLVELYATVPDPSAARLVYDSARKAGVPSSDLAVRTHRYLGRLDEAWRGHFGAKQ